jgi:signal transduction histidine kinase
MRVFHEAAIRTRFARGEGLVGHTWATKRPIWYDTSAPPRELAHLTLPRLEVSREVGLRVAFMVPVVMGEEVTAVLEFGTEEARPADPWAVELVSVCARQIGSMLERKRVEATNSVLQTAMRDMQDGVRVTTPVGDPSGFRVLYANTACVRMLGFDDPAELIAAPGDVNWGPATDREIIARAGKEVAEGRPTRMELVLYRKDRSEIEIEASVTPVMGAEGQHLMTVNVFRDLGAIRREAAQRSALEESLRRNETMAALGRIVAGVAHEVRNPLFGIGATLDAFEARFGGVPEQASYLKVLRSEIARLATLMNELLDYGRPASLARTEISVADVVDDALARCAGSAKAAGVALQCAARPGPSCTAKLDRSRIMQVLINLVENAIQHSPAAGRVTVSCSRGDGEATLLVEDEGPGFPAADLVRVFEPFFSKRKGGTGLGLSIVQRIAEMHGGRVEAKNRPTGGAAISVTLPLEGHDGR